MWCVNKDGRIGDLLLIYRKLWGIVRIETIMSDSPIREYECSDIGYRTVNTQFVLNLGRPITARELKSDSTLCKLPAVRRNFQFTTFRIPNDVWPKLKRLISSHCREADYENNKWQKRKFPKRRKRSIKVTGSDTDFDFYL